MTPDIAREEALQNQSRIVYSLNGNQYVTYSNTVTTPIIGPVITLLKSSEATQAFPGIPIIFTVTITNSGNRAADITIYDLPEEGTEFVPNSVQRDGVPLPGANPVSGLPLGTIDINQTIRITFQLVNNTYVACEELSNQVRGDYSFVATDGRIVRDSVLSNILTLPVIVIGRPDIQVTLSVSKNRATPGETLRYTAVVTNLGDVPADVFLFSSIPRGTLFVRNSITVNGAMQSGDFLPTGIPLGLVTPRKQSIVTFDVTVTGTNVVLPGQMITNQALTEGTYRNSECIIVPIEPSLSNTVSTVVYYPLCLLEVCTTPSTVEPEEVVHFTCKLTNIGNMAADVALSHLIIRQTALVSGSIRVNGVPVANPDSSGTIFLGNVLPKGEVIITYQVMISPFVTSHVLRGFVTAPYSSELNGVRYFGEVNSNPYVINIEHYEE